MKNLLPTFLNAPRNKRLLFIISTVFYFSCVCGQTIKEFYLPSKYERAEYSFPDKYGNSTEWTKIIMYSTNVEGFNGRILETNFYNGSAVAITSNYVDFTDNEVLLGKDIVTNGVMTNVQHDYNPKIPILKMPPKGKTITWTYHINNDYIQCTSSWVEKYYSENGKIVAVPVIKLINTWIHPNIGKSSRVDYYELGTGLWKEEILSSNGKTQLLFERKTLTHSEVVRENEKEHLLLNAYNVTANTQTDKQEEKYDKEFKTVQIQAKYPGGPTAWISFLAKNIHNNKFIENGASAGQRLRVMVSFIVNKEGETSEVKAEDDPGYGAGAEAVRLIKLSGKWQPAEQDGHKVTYRQKQEIIFNVNK